MKKILLCCLFALAATTVHSQTVAFNSPPLAGKRTVLYYFAGAKVDSLVTTIDISGKATFTIPNGNYQGMAAIAIPGAGGIEIVVAEPAVLVECNSNQLNNETVAFPTSKENNFLKHIFTSQSRYMQQQAWLQAGGQFFDANSPFLKQLQPELDKVNTSMQSLDKEINSSNLYAAKYYRFADFMNRLFDTEQKRDAGGAMFIRKEMEESLDIASLYYSGQLWNSVLNFYASLFNHTAAGDKQQQFATSVWKTSTRLTEPYYEAFLAGIITETERFGWRQAQDSILSKLHPEYLPENQTLSRALAAYRVSNSRPMPPVAGLDKPKEADETILLAFYDSDCSSCVNEMFRLVVLYPRLKEKGIRVVSIAADTDKKKYEQGIRDFPWKDKLCDFKGFEGENFSSYNVIGSPSFYLVGSDNKLLGQYYSVGDLQEAAGIR